jgi:hypothetical protein
MTTPFKSPLFLLLALLALACRPQPEGEGYQQRFRLLEPDESGVRFVNRLRETAEFNYFTYPFIYFGGGAATGDLNNDGLPDLFLTSNMEFDALYLNRSAPGQGGLKFEDITQAAGVAGLFGRWTTGVTMADVNNDGYLDMYVSVAGPNAPAERKNLLYVNNGPARNGVPTFTEQAEAYGIADEGHSIQSAFFDYDNDGDLDLYVGNYPPSGFGMKTDFFAPKVKNPTPAESDRLYRNDGGHFTDVTQQAGLLNYGLTLGLSVADFNDDGYLDLYVSNDFNSPDYLFINQRNGQFRDELGTYARHTANFGMGTDAADVNNDGHLDLIQLDMMGSTNAEQKTNMSAMNPALFYQTTRAGLHHQYMKNVLQLNTGRGGFVDVGELAGIATTDWSWGGLLFDMNNDGTKDLFITNGMRRNVNDNDFNAYFAIQKAYRQIDPARYAELLRQIPVRPVANVGFLNEGDLRFAKTDSAYGLNFKGFSNGAAYADFDGDGDLDLVVNNIDRPAQVYENTSVSGVKPNFLRLKLSGTVDNRFGIGTRVRVFTGSGTFTEELMPTRGYESSVEPIVHVGLGRATAVDSVHLFWPKGGFQRISNPPLNQLTEVRQAVSPVGRGVLRAPVPAGMLRVVEPALQPDFVHQENQYDDFATEVLLPHRMSQHGPALAVADVNRDGRDDFYVGGAQGQPGALYVQQKDGSFRAMPGATWQADRAHEDVAALFFDANQDGYSDLFVVSGGNERPAGDGYYAPRLYLNAGGRCFRRAPDALPRLSVSGSCVRAADVDRDGDLDLFVGGRQVPGRYPLPASSYLLRNESGGANVRFSVVEVPALTHLGLVTDAVWTDLDRDDWLDLVVVGEWMAPTVFRNQRGTLTGTAQPAGLAGQVGWWNTVAAADLDADGDPDLVLGNLGLNYKYKASPREPFKVYADDFDGNGRLDIVLGYYDAGRLYPVRGRSCSSQQMPSIKKKFPTYAEFSKADLSTVYSREKLSNATRYEAVNFATSVALNEGHRFTIKALPRLAQLSSVNAVLVRDFNGDGKPDLLLAGNQYESEVETPRADAGLGTLLLGDGRGGFAEQSPGQSGLAIQGEVRHLHLLNGPTGTARIMVARNEEKLLMLEQNRLKP